MNPIVYAIPVFMLSIVLEAWVARRRGVKVYDIPDAITSLHHGVISQITGLFMKLATLGIYVLVYDNYRATDLPADNLWVWAGALIAFDFCYYWAHRMGHEVNVLWASHVVHHSSEYYNLSTALRQTSTGGFFGWLFYFPLAVAGVPPSVFVAVGLINLLYQYWVHTELIGKLGWFDHVFSSPSNHRVHHGQNDYCIDKNYGGIFVLWDKLFGTFEAERDAEPVYFGIRSPLKSFNPLWGNLHYYAEIVGLAKAATGWRAKLGAWLAPPGGWDVPLPHFEPASFTRFDPQTPGAIRWYVALQYAVMVPFITHLLAIFGNLSLGPALAYAGGIFCTCLILGGLLERRRMALRLEQCRVTALGIAFATLPDWFGFDAPALARASLLLFSLGCAAWLARQSLTPASVSASSGEQA